jgi:hypothetical protein
MITVTTDFYPVAFLLRDSAPDGVTVSFGPIIERRDFGASEAITIVVTAIVGIPATVIANWLTEKLKGQKSTKIRIHRTEIHCDNGDLKRIVEETISVDYES